jgi:hypothetical protein
MTTTHERVRAVREALVELRRGDLEAIIDIERYAQHYPNHYVDWADLRWDDPDHVRGSDDDDFAGYNAELQRYFVRNLRGISGHVLGRLWEFHLRHILEAGATEREPPGPGDPHAVLLTETPSPPF